MYYSVLPSCFKARLMPVAARPYFRRFVTNAFICGRFWVIPFGGNQFICGHSVRIIRWPSVPACSPQRQRYPYQTHSCRWHQRPGGKRYIRHTQHSPQQKISQATIHGQKMQAAQDRIYRRHKIKRFFFLRCRALQPLFRTICVCRFKCFFIKGSAVNACSAGSV